MVVELERCDRLSSSLLEVEWKRIINDDESDFSDADDDADANLDVGYVDLTGERRDRIRSNS